MINQGSQIFHDKFALTTLASSVTMSSALEVELVLLNLLGVMCINGHVVVVLRIRGVFDICHSVKSSQFVVIMNRI